MASRYVCLYLLVSCNYYHKLKLYIANISHNLQNSIYIEESSLGGFNTEINYSDSVVGSLDSQLISMGIGRIDKYLPCLIGKANRVSDYLTLSSLYLTKTEFETIISKAYKICHLLFVNCIIESSRKYDFGMPEYQTNDLKFFHWKVSPNQNWGNDLNALESLFEAISNSSMCSSLNYVEFNEWGVNSRDVSKLLYRYNLDHVKTSKTKKRKIPKEWIIF